MTFGKCVPSNARALFVGLLCLAASGCAHFGPGQTATPAFWRVEGKNGGSLHLLGSVHVGASGGWDLPPAIDEAFSAAQVLVLEVDDSELDANAIAWQIHERASLPPQLRLASVISPETHELVVSRLVELELDPEMLEGFEPWFAAFVLVEKAYSAEGYSAADGVDRRLLQRAGNEMFIAGLESVKDQLALFDGLPMALQEAMLRDTLLSSTDLWESVDRLLEAWRTGDDERLNALIFGDLADHPELVPFYEAVFFERNERMTEGFVRWLASDHRVFGVVGAGHLIGDRGVVALLRERGYQVERVDTRSR